MKQSFFDIIENKPLREGVMRLKLRGDCSAIERAGQFVNIKIEGQFLRRPLSVCDWENGKLCLLYKVVGEGTRAMAEMKPGEKLDILSGLGNGFNVEKWAKNNIVDFVVGGSRTVNPDIDWYIILSL